jgi:hypothetical protein
MPKADIKTKKFCGIYAVVYPKATFPTLWCPANSQQAGIRVFGGKKSRVKISLHKTILNRRAYRKF